MRRTFIIIMLALCFANAALAQEGKTKETVEAIRKHYTELKEVTDRMVAAYSDKGVDVDGPIEDYYDEPPAYFETTVRQNLPATGPHKETFRFFYYEYEDYEAEGGPEFWRKIHLATVAYNFAAHNYYEEYLFDEEGELMFIYARTCDTNMYEQVDFRFYFDKGKLIHSIIQGRDREDEAFQPIPMQERFKPYVEQYTRYAQTVKDLYDAIDTAEHF